MNRSNLGMYRVQLSGGQYEPNREVGLHYQIHRGIAAHHAAALRRGETTAGERLRGRAAGHDRGRRDAAARGHERIGLGRRARPAARADDLPRRPTADPRRGRFLHHRLARSRTGSSPRDRSAITWATTAWPTSFRCMRVEHVYHRRDAIWPFTVVGRPPQEDTILGQLIHELAGPAIPKQIPGVRAVHAVDAAGVHPLLLAIGSERYVPYDQHRRPRELLTLANALLGHGQLSLAKYLWIAAAEDNPELDVRNVPDFFRHVLERVDWRRDLHFQTCTTHRHARLQQRTAQRRLEGGDRGGRPAAADAAGRVATISILPEDLGFRRPRVVLPGVLVVEGPPYQADVPSAAQTVLRALSIGDAADQRVSAGGGGGRERFRRRRRWKTFSGRRSPGAIRRRTSTASSRSCPTSTGAAAARW